MRSAFYISTTDIDGLERGKVYYVDERARMKLKEDKKVRANSMILKGMLKEIPRYNGCLQEQWTWATRNNKVKMKISDGIVEEEMDVLVIEVHRTTKRFLLCLVQLPREEELVQVAIPRLI